MKTRCLGNDSYNFKNYRRAYKGNDGKQIPVFKVYHLRFTNGKRTARIALEHACTRAANHCGGRAIDYLTAYNAGIATPVAWLR